MSTCSASRSASEKTATGAMPSSRHARITRTAISPRFATRTFAIRRVVMSLGSRRRWPSPRPSSTCKRRLHPVSGSMPSRDSSMIPDPFIGSAPCALAATPRRRGSQEPLEGLAQEALVDNVPLRDRRLDEALRVPPRGLALDVAGHQPAVAILIGEPAADEVRTGAGMLRRDRDDLVELGA